MSDLWCIHISGPDDTHAASSKAHAIKMAIDHNIAIQDYIAENPLEDDDPPIDALLAVVMPWPWDEATHAADLASRETTP